MATVKIVLDTKKNNQRKDGSFPIKMKVEHDGKHLPINLKIYAHIHAWTGARLNNKYKGVKNYKAVNLDLENKLVSAKNILDELNVEIRTWNCKQLRDFISSAINKNKIEKRNKKKENSRDFFITDVTGIKTIKLHEYGDSLIEYCKSQKMFSKVERYQEALNAFAKYTESNNDITIAQITTKVLEEWQMNMKAKPLKDSTYKTYLRNLRAIINKGIKEHKLPLDGNYGFQYFKIGADKETKKRALNINSIKKLFTVSLEKETSIWHTQQQAIFMFNTNGINFKDLAYLRINQIVGNFDRIVYTRSKTSKNFDIVIAGKSKNILKYYVSKNGKGLISSDLIFPILPEEIIGKGKEEKTLYESRRKTFNQNLKKIAKISEVESNVTSYVIRHSFATGLKHSGVDENEISESMGHDSVETTRVYLDSFETDKKDNVTKSIAI